MSKFPKYKLTDKQIRGIANIVLHEQGTVAGWYAEASQIANRTDIKGDSYATAERAVKTVTSGWYAKGKARYNAGTSNPTVIAIVKRVFCDGFRTLPRYVDEHDCMSDISIVREGGKNVKSDKSKWKRHTTVIKNKMSSTYYFYEFPDGYKSGNDPFGYTTKANRQKWGDFCYSVAEAKQGKPNAEKATSKTESQLRAEVTNVLDMLSGIREGSAEHKMIINTFNNSGLCTRYKMTTKDAWCATAVSFAFIVSKLAGKAGSGSLFECVECSCAQMIKLAQKQGIWVESDSYTPKTGDIILYDWQDSGLADNKGTPDHVGIVKTVKDGVITVIEGNYKDSVGVRKIKVNGKNIRGFICPKYASFAKKDTSVAEKPKQTQKAEQSVKKVYTGTFPALPPRGWYQHGDGIRTYLSYRSHIKNVQKLTNWILDISLETDGKYGNLTEEAVKDMQELFGIKVDGCFGKDTLSKARSYKK